MKSFPFLFVLIVKFAAAQEKPVPVFFNGPDVLLVDTTLWREHNLRSATVTQVYNDDQVVAYFETDSLFRRVAEYARPTLTHYTYLGRRVATQAIHKAVYLEHLNVPHEIDSIFFSYPNANTVVVNKKQYQLGSTRNHLNAALNEKWYLMRWDDVDWGGLTDIAYYYPFFARTPWNIYSTYPNGAYRVPRYDGQYVLEEKFKTDYADTALYCIKQSKEVRINDSVVSRIETVEPDVAFEAPRPYFQQMSCGRNYFNYHLPDNRFFTESEHVYDNDLLVAIVAKNYQTDGQGLSTTRLMSSVTEYRLAYSFFDR